MYVTVDNLLSIFKLLIDLTTLVIVAVHYINGKKR